ncbi:MAG: DUF4097 family beta strand repeat-containing protein [Candidatus Bipolaricaulota bacterium]|nr:DUF4097 family beta strand repeat-containing protein [Candidatus Bipolaricaulota bacterium]MDW8328521.1 DUF4097 family beta strand repeat-containing protein [Candidatus Bipolaricaulota bacterium]
MARLEDRFERTLSVSGPVKLMVETGSGDIQVRRGAEGTLVVQGRVFIHALSRDQAHELAAKIKSDPPIEVSGNTVKVGDLSKYRESISWFLGPFLGIDFDIQVPYETEAKIDSGSGDQLIRDIRGPVRAEAGSGDIHIAHIEREVTVDTGSGNIAVVGSAKVSADAGSGDIELREIAGDVQIDVGSGDVVLQEIGGNIDVDTGSGDIRIDSGLGTGVRWQLETSSGDVSISLPAEARFALAVETSSGDIEVDFPLTVTGKLSKHELRGTVGDSPSAQIKIETSSGDVRIQKR